MGHFVAFQWTLAPSPAPTTQTCPGAADGGGDTAGAWAKLFGKGQLQAAENDKMKAQEREVREKNAREADARKKAREAKIETLDESFFDTPGGSHSAAARLNTAVCSVHQEL